MPPAILFSMVGVLLIVLAIPMIRRRVPPNRWYGLRIAATLNDERVWYEANAVSGRDLLVEGAVICILSWILPFFMSSAMQALFEACVVSLLSVAVAVRGAVIANRMAKQ